MNLSAPTQPVFIISLILAVLAVIGVFVAIPLITPNAFWVAIIAYVVLAIGNGAWGLNPRAARRPRPPAGAPLGLNLNLSLA